MNIAIIDAGAGNLKSIYNFFFRNFSSTIKVYSSQNKDLDASEVLILPGVGHFGHVSKNLKDTNLDERFLLRRLHLFKNNTLYSGIDAFIELWIEIPRYKFLGNILKKPVIYQISWIFYEIIAIILFFQLSPE